MFFNKLCPIEMFLKQKNIHIFTVLYVNAFQKQIYNYLLANERMIGAHNTSRFYSGPGCLCIILCMEYFNYIFMAFLFVTV